MELLAPAGNFEKLMEALHFGADAVYLSGTKYGLRAFAGNFTNEEIEKAVRAAHRLEKKVYVAVNMIAKDEDFEGLQDWIKFLQRARVDGVIVADLGVLAFIKVHAPTMAIHVSTQANILNSVAANMMAELGVRRIILARELSLEEVKKIRSIVPERVKIEVFVHGAMCMAYSGRCMLSNYLTGRDANRGECVQACRWKYFVREESREDELEVQEDEKGTYIFNSKDLNMIDHLKELEDAGVDSIKIEGRMKSTYYVATVVNAYRKALDALPNPPSQQICAELEHVSHRRYTTGFYFDGEQTMYTESSTPVQEGEFVALVTQDCDGEFVEVEMRNKFSVGESLQVLSPMEETFGKTLEVTKIITEEGEEVNSAKVVQQKVKIPCTLPLKKFDILRR